VSWSAISTAGSLIARPLHRHPQADAGATSDHARSRCHPYRHRRGSGMLFRFCGDPSRSRPPSPWPLLPVPGGEPELRSVRTAFRDLPYDAPDPAGERCSMSSCALHPHATAAMRRHRRPVNLQADQQRAGRLHRPLALGARRGTLGSNTPPSLAAVVDVARPPAKGFARHPHVGTPPRSAG